MSCRCAAVGLSLLGLLSLAPGLANCSEPGARPLQLRLAASSPPVAQGNAGSELRASTERPHSSASQRAPRFAQAIPSLRQRALQSVLAAPEQSPDDAAASAGQAEARFRFEHQGSAFRNLSRGYRDMCATVSNKVWDEPNGRRIKFDVAGKPGVAVEIPIR